MPVSRWSIELGARADFVPTAMLSHQIGGQYISTRSRLQPPRNTLKQSSSVSCPKLEDAKGRPVDTSDEGLLPPGCLFELLPFRTSA